MSAKYVQYGCGLTAPDGWENYDASPTLQIQKIPGIGQILKRRMNVQFPDNVMVGDIITGLPVKENSCDAVFCSHTLEHLALEDFRKALLNTYKILKNGGVFRCIVPDLEWSAERYLEELKRGEEEASIRFMNEVLLGVERKPAGIKERLISLWGNAHHLWMWDHYSLTKELRNIGFREIRRCQIGDNPDKMFELVEQSFRFKNAVAIECKR